jgi:hypothetical protein
MFITAMNKKLRKTLSAFLSAAMLSGIAGQAADHLAPSVHHVW